VSSRLEAKLKKEENVLQVEMTVKEKEET